MARACDVDDPAAFGEVVLGHRPPWVLVVSPCESGDLEVFVVVAAAVAYSQWADKLHLDAAFAAAEDDDEAVVFAAACDADAGAAV